MFIEFKDLKESDLIVDNIYMGGNNGNMSDEVLSKLMKCENSCGFRKKGSLKDKKLKYVVLYSNGNNGDWNDDFDITIDEFIYYGDQNKPNKSLWDTPKKGNEILRRIFDMLKKGEKINIPPFFIFVKHRKRDVIFKGLAVPGSYNKNIEKCLEVVTIKSKDGYIKNYRAIFTILNEKNISRKWLYDLENNLGLISEFAPLEWKNWINNKCYYSIAFNKFMLKSKEKNKEYDIENLLKDIDFKAIYKSPDIYNKGKFTNEFYTGIDSKEIEQYVDEYKNKQIIGFVGENIIFKFEQVRLKNSKYKELVKKASDIQWSSRVIGDGLGYDIKSYDVNDGNLVDKYIEVKTTLGEDTAFEITFNEVEKSKILANKGIYVIARVYNLDFENKTANFYFQEGNLEENYELKTDVYIAHRK